jgi:hypothetical protein
LEALMKREANPRTPVFSVYLDTDQSREINLERGFKVVLKDIAKALVPRTEALSTGLCKRERPANLRVMKSARPLLNLQLALGCGSQITSCAQTASDPHEDRWKIWLLFVILFHPPKPSMTLAVFT